MLIAEYDYETGIRIKQEDSWQIGISEGITQGIEAFILDNLEEQIPKERIIEKPQRTFNLTIAEAGLYYKKFSSK